MPYKVSTILIMMASVFPPENPAMVPQITPMIKATEVAKKPTIKDILLPYIILLVNLYLVCQFPINDQMMEEKHLMQDPDKRNHMEQ